MKMLKAECFDRLGGELPWNMEGTALGRKTNNKILTVTLCVTNWHLGLTHFSTKIDWQKSIRSDWSAMSIGQRHSRLGVKGYLEICKLIMLKATLHKKALESPIK